MLWALLLLPVADDLGVPASTHDGGVCAGLSWVALEKGEKAFVERGPDFDVLRFEGPRGSNDHWWGVYSGGYAQVSGNGPVLFKRDGVTVRRAEEEGAFRGYLAQRGNAQNHFFGSVFTGKPQDRDFFSRIDFGPKGQALCRKVR